MSRGLTFSILMALVMAPALTSGQILPFDVPLEERAPRVARDAVRVVVIGTPDPRITRLSAQRLSSRRRGEARARRSIHRWVDQSLARVRASASAASAAHRAIDTHAAVVGHRPMVAGDTVIVMDMPLSELRSAVPGVPWAR